MRLSIELAIYFSHWFRFLDVGVCFSHRSQYWNAASSGLLKRKVTPNGFR